ncbi:hypothetical protein D1007_31169 [Hordeum vulgare]|uniref:uncharacterized protein LOC123426325 isoform X2 n=1 Tax=Hordeum vulgare subsp. vulgare TaxID=112509 RepID=UPI001D1A3413|nr:uncharacterized protein LOC123426325 isoform X2 [Hordeum vulgare subsp. vulgare]KAE8794108.1 hypothetical protein D1007_31169 [Hordeum vulgare]
MSSARLTQNGLGAALAGDTNLTPARQPALRQRRRQGHAPERQVARPRLRGRRDLPRDVCCPAQRPGALGARPPRLPRAARRVRHQHGRQLKAERGRARGPHPHSSGACTFSGPYRAPPATRAARPRSRTTVASHSVPVRRLAGAGARHRHRRGIRAPREFPRREAQRAVWVHLRLSSSAPPSSPTQLGISTSSWRASSSGRRTPAWRPPTRWLSSLATSPTVRLLGSMAR